MQTNDIEIWRGVVGYEKFYAVSNQGRVKALHTTNRGRLRKAGILSPRVNKRGYLAVGLYDADRRRTTYLVHTLVLLAFVGPRPLKYHCRHFPDPTPSNNNLSNISWSTAKQNQADRIIHGTANSQIDRISVKGQNNNFSKLKDKDIPIIKTRIAAGEKPKNIAKDYDVHANTIRAIVRGQTWRHLKS